MVTTPRLLPRFLAECPYEPATALFRAFEIEHLTRTPFPEGRGLDLGCGTGRLMRVVLDDVGPRRVVGLEPDPFEAELARESGTYDAVHIAPGESIPEPDASFDFVFSNSVLEHIPALDAVLAEVSRVLRSGGSFIFTVPADTFHTCLRGPVLPWVSRDRYLIDLDKRLVHLRYPTEAEWSEMLSEVGLDLKSCSRYLSPHQTRRWETLSRATGGLLYSLSRKRARPIEVQRKLSVRSSWTLPLPLARVEARLVSLGLPRTRDSGVSGGMMIRAVRT
jgi:SAM-dependent methyltransferase